MPRNLLIYFGNSQNSIDPKCYKKPEIPVCLDFLEQNKKTFKLDTLIFPKQVHGIQEIIISDKIIFDKNSYELSNLPKSWSIESDYIITDQKNIGIGVLTADCLPIIIVDSHNSNNNSVVAVIHAGWKGAVNGIIESCINNLINNFGSNPENLKAYFGPCAKICCYEVQNDFVSILPKNYQNTLNFKSNNKIYFDLPKLAQIKLESLGLIPENINLENNLCTMCNPSFCSYRNNKNCKRQISLVAIQ